MCQGVNVEGLEAYNIRKGLDHVLANAPQLTKADRWFALARYIINKIIAARSKNSQLLGSLPPFWPLE